MESGSGTYLVGDRHIPWLRVHDSDGRLLTILGRFGDGPGEFRKISGVVETAFGIYVSDYEAGRITRFSHSWRFDTTFVIPGYPSRMARSGEALVVQIYGVPGTEGQLHVVDQDMEILTSFKPLDSLVVNVPYWGSFSDVEFALVDHRVIAADEFLYPMEVFDLTGRPLDVFGEPPPSWRQAPELEFAALTGPAMATRMREWLETFTVLERIDTYRDSVILVTHARNVPTPSSARNREQYGVDIYSASGKKLATDVTLPGQVIGAGEYVYVVLSGPPHPWTIGVYEGVAGG